MKKTELTLIRKEWIPQLPMIAALLATTQDGVLDLDEAAEDALDLLHICSEAIENLE